MRWSRDKQIFLLAGDYLRKEWKYVYIFMLPVNLDKVHSHNFGQTKIFRRDHVNR